MVSFLGQNSVRDRTIFVKKGPIAKSALPILTGNGLKVLSETDVEIPTGSFTPAQEGYLLEIDSFSPRNSGTFTINKVISPTVLRLSNASFDILDPVQTLQDLITLSNDLKKKYEYHRSQVTEIDDVIIGVHGTNDSVNIVTAPVAEDLPTLLALVNDIKTQFEAHRVSIVGVPTVHKNMDSRNTVYSPDATDLGSSLHLLNELYTRYEDHRQEKFFHITPDVINRIQADLVSPVISDYPSSQTGPFNWTIFDPQYGRTANDPTDVSVRVNGNPAVVDAVIGQLGAVVLRDKPSFGDDVKIDYSAIKDPPQKFLKLNSEAFHLNQAGNNALGGFPEHLYQGSSYIADPGSLNSEFGSPLIPKRIGWKYKAFERAYSAVLNDPTTLLLNVPSNKISFPVLEQKNSEVNINYSANILPEESADPWVSNGDGKISLDQSSKSLSMKDESGKTGVGFDPPFFSKILNIDSPSIISAAFRVRVLEEELLRDGVFSGVAFGISDGLHLVQVGFLLTEAVNLSSGIHTANFLKRSFNSHLLQKDVHDPDDLNSAVPLADSFDLPTFIYLANSLREKYSSHISSGFSNIHYVADSVNTLSSPPSSSLSTALTLINELRDKFNSHLTQFGVHFLNDGFNAVPYVRQIGILKNTGSHEFSENWKSFAVDWTEFTSYRLFRESDGDCFIYLSGSIDPVISVQATELPKLSDTDLDLDSLQQVYFGSVSREAKSISEWQFVRLIKTPIESVYMESNKSVEYDGSVVPQLDTQNPWVDIGNGGYERIVSPSTLLLDATSGASLKDVSQYGFSTGSFRGYVRLEPIQTGSTTTSCEFQFSTDFYTHGVDNQALSVVLDDDCFTTQLSFLQFTPKAGSTTGIISQPYIIQAGDELVLKSGGGNSRVITFSAGDISAASVASKINTVFGFVLASDSGGKLKITSKDSGSKATFEIISGTAIPKLGLIPGVYIGTDSNPEPKVTWFGSDFPDKNDPAWIIGGEQIPELIGRKLRINDSNPDDFLTYSQTSPIVTNQAISFSHDWKMNCRLQMMSFVPGETLYTSSPYLDLDFAGALVNVDEGPSGKNVEIHFSSFNSNYFINLVTYNSLNDNLEVISQYAFNWNDGKVHSVSLYTNKTSNQVFVDVDGTILSPFSGPTPTYSSLKPGLSGPSITFGSGAFGASNVDLSKTKSVCDWESVCIFRDSKISDPTAASRRYVGLYMGGEVSEISSYIAHQIDWAQPHTYRVIRDPLSAVSLYVDGSSVPVITTSYDSLSLPPVSSSFLNPATNDRSNVSFGAFNPLEISRTRWNFFQYSVGKLTRSELLIPPHQLYNQHNVITSGEHLRTKLKHYHHGFTVYSGGSADDDFLARTDLEARTILNEGTPPVPMTQDLEGRGGAVKTATIVGSVPTEDFVNFRGNISNFDNDTFNGLTFHSIASFSNLLRDKYNAHIDSGLYHRNQDTSNSELLTANSVSTSIVLLNSLKARFNAHRLESGVHEVDDSVNVISTTDATDLDSATILANSIGQIFNDHIVDTVSHNTFDTVNTLTEILPSSLPAAIQVINDFKSEYLAHLSQYNVHLENDSENVLSLSDATDLNSAVLLANEAKRLYNLHRTAIVGESQSVHITNDSINVASIPDATDILTLTELLIHLVDRYDSHRYEVNVHSASAFIHVQVFERVLYDNIQFWKTEEGDDVQLSPFCDCLSLGSDSSYSNINTFDWVYSANESPDQFILWQTIRLANDMKGTFNDHIEYVPSHVVPDHGSLVSAPDATDLSTLITLLNALKTAYNGHITSPFHFFPDSLNSITTVNASNLGSAQALANALRSRYESHRVNTAMHISADATYFVVEPPTVNPGHSSWQLFTIGGDPFVSNNGSTTIFGTPILTQSIYRYDNIVPSSASINFEFFVRMRVNAFSPPTANDYDTRIYSGFTSEMSPGVAAAIGFEFVGGKPMVKIHDMNSDIARARVHNDWTTAGFKTYKIIRDADKDEFRLEIE